MEGLTLAFPRFGEAGLGPLGWLGLAPWGFSGALMLEKVASAICIWALHTLLSSQAWRRVPKELCTLGTLDGSMENVCFSICSVSGTFICASSHHHCHTEQSFQPKAFPGACSFHQPWCFQASWYPPSCFYSCLRSSRLGLRDVGDFFLSFFKITYLFFGCAGSWSLHVGFLSPRQSGASL